jgi:hypothetical protein
MNKIMKKTTEISPTKHLRDVALKVAGHVTSVTVATVAPTER